MIKYVLCVLLVTILAWGLGNTSSIKDSQKLQPEASAASVSDCTEPCCISSAAIDSPSIGYYSLFNDEMSGYRISDGIFSTLSLPRELGSSKTLSLKFPTATRLFNTLCTQQPKEESNYLDFNHNFIKYRCRYYVYTIEHILI